MLFPHCLAQLPATASAPATQAAASNLAVFLINATFLVWAILAAIALLKFRIFWTGSLQNAPARAAKLLVPALAIVFLLYVLFARVALLAGASTGWLQLPIQSPPAATASAPAASAPAAVSAPSVPASAPSISPLQDLHLESLNGAAELLAILAALALVPFLFHDGFRGIGLHPRQFPSGILLGILAFLIIYPLLLSEGAILNAIYHHFGHEMSTHQTIKEMQTTPNFFIKLGDSLIAGFLAPFCEEIFFRGFLQSALIQRPGDTAIWLAARVTGRPLAPYRPSPLRRWFAILIASAIFAAAHFAPDQFPILFLLAIGLGYTYERTGNLYACMTIHALFNLTSLIQILLFT